VSPPPDLASGNQKPASAQFTIALDPTTGSEAGSFSTNDIQAGVILSAGAFPPTPRQDAVLLTITPLDPAQFAGAPSGMTIVGNIYRIQATLQPSGEELSGLDKRARVFLGYPARPDVFSTDHTVLVSPDGQSWQPVQSIDTISQQQTLADVRILGYFAVGVSAEATTKRSSWTRFIPTIAIGLVVALLALFIARFELKAFRARKAERRRRRKRR
jgi:hypothetical protein